MKSRLTLGALSEASGVDDSTISHGEVGDRKMTMAVLEPIVTKGFRISLSRFFGPIPKFKPMPNKGGRPRKNGKPNAGARA